MSKKTKRVHRRHKTHKKHHKRHYKKHRKYTRRHHRLYRKRRDILIIPGSQGSPLFSAPIKNKSINIPTNKHNDAGNMIPGLRDM